MKSCSSLFATLLFVSFLTLSAFAGQAQPQPTSNTSATAPSAATSANIATQPSKGVAAAAVPQASQSDSNPRILTPGTTIVAEFAGSVNVKKLKVGDKVKAVLAQDFVADGRLVAKQGSKVIGHVTEAKRRSNNESESRLGVVFDKILLKNHQELDFAAIIQALAPPVIRRSRVDEPDQMMPPSMANMGRGPAISRGSNGRASSSGPVASSVSILGPMATVQSTPGSNPGDSMGTMRRGESGSGNVISGGVGMHGVHGLKDLELRPAAPGTNSGPAIVSTKSDVKLQGGTQVLILIVN